jgi:ribonuclease Z
VQAPELDVCFDHGECPLSSLSLNHVLLTHAHGDHARCLPRHWQLRRMMGFPKQAAYILPEEIREGCEAWVRAEARFEGVPEEDAQVPGFIGLAPGDTVALPHRKDLRVRAFEVEHRAPSLGYTVLDHRRKLRAEYLGLPGPEIARLRQSGVDVSVEVDEPLVTFIGDCTGPTAHIWRSPVLILEATFLDPGEEEHARKKAHTHLFDITRALREFGDEIAATHIVLKHFSMKYTPEHVLARVAAEVPPAFRERVHVFL